LPITYDSLIFQNLDLHTVPYCVIINEEGMVVGVTASTTKEEIQSYFEGKKTLWPKYLTEFVDIDFAKPLFINDNGGSDTSFLFRSILTPWIPELGMRWYDFQKTAAFKHTNWSSRNKKGIQITGADLLFLYRIAYSGSSYFRPGDSIYYGKIWNWPIVESKDSLKYIANYKTGENIYCYSLQVPKQKATDETLKAMMKADLQNYFGFKVSLEKRMMPYWKLVVIDEKKKARIISKKATTKNFSGASNKKETMQFNDVPVSTLIEEIWSYHQYEPPFIDETNISGNINMELNAVMTDLLDIKENLNKNGLDVVKGKKEMTVIILKNYDNSN
jgi:hypothetical protein